MGRRVIANMFYLGLVFDVDYHGLVCGLGRVTNVMVIATIVSNRANLDEVVAQGCAYEV